VFSSLATVGEAVLNRGYRDGTVCSFHTLPVRLPNWRPWFATPMNEK